MALRAVRDGDGNIIDFEWIYANPAAERVLSWRVGGLVGRQLHEVPPELGLAGQFEAFHQVVETGESCQQVFPHSCEGFDGWLQATVARFRDGVLVRLGTSPPRAAPRRGCERRGTGWWRSWSTCPRASSPWMPTGATRTSTATRCCSRASRARSSSAGTSGHLPRDAGHHRRARVPPGDGRARVHLVRAGVSRRRLARHPRVPVRDGIAIFFRDVTEKKAAQQERDKLLSASTRAGCRRRRWRATRPRAAGGPGEAGPVREAGGGRAARGRRGARDQQPAVLRDRQHPLRAGAARRCRGSAREELQETAEALTEAREGAERIRGIVRDLKTFARGDDVQLRPVDVHAALEFSLSMAMNHIRYRAQAGEVLRPRAAGAGQRGQAGPGVPQPARQRGAGHPRGGRRRATASASPRGCEEGAWWWR